jgi:hypothetical protein
MRTNPAEIIYQDLAACFLALANALEAKHVLSKSEFAAAAQERYLALRSKLPPEDVEQLVLLHAIATQVERKPGD